MSIYKKSKDFLISWMTVFYFIFPLAIFLHPSKDATTNIFYLGVLLPWLFLLLMGEVKLLRRNNIYLSGLALFSYLWLNSLWSEHNNLNDNLYLLKRLVFAVCLLTAPAIIVIKRPHFFQQLLPFIFIAGVISSAIILGLHYQHYGNKALLNRLIGWGYGFNPIAAGIHYGIAVLIGLHLVKQFKAWRIAIVISMSLPLLALMLTQSRGPILALLCALVLFAIISSHSRPIVMLKLAVAVLIGGLALIVGWDQLVHRGLSWRPEIWAQAWELGQQHLLFGEGFSLNAERINFQGTEVTHSHNFILEIFRYGGVIGVLLCAWHLISLFKGWLKNTNDQQALYLTIFCFGLGVMLLNGWYLLDRPNYYWMNYWLPIGALIASEATTSVSGLKDKTA